MVPSTPHLRSSPAPRRARAATPAARLYVAIIADIVRSRRIKSGLRRELQRRLEAELSQINAEFAEAIAAKFLITTGDEFQGLLRDASVIPTLLRRLEARFPEIAFRIGVGRDRIHTDLREYAVGMDGPAWHAARAAIEQAKLSNRLGGVFSGFGARHDSTLNGFARILHHVRARLTSKQRQLLEALLGGETQKEVARRLGISKQAVSKQALAAGWEGYGEAERAWRDVLAAPDAAAAPYAGAAR